MVVAVTFSRFKFASRETMAPTTDPGATSALTNTTTVVFGVAFAVQRLLDIFDDPLSRLWPRPANKKVAAAVIASLIGIAATWVGGLTLIYKEYPHFDQGLGAWLINLLVMGLAMGAGTEGVNSVLKFAQYSKDSKRADAQPLKTLPPPPAIASAAVQLARRIS